MSFARGLKRSRSLDDKVRHENTTDDRFKRLNELGEKFVSDKEELEAKMELIENAEFSDADKKRELKADLEVAINKITEKYDADVKEEEERLKEEDLKHLEEINKDREESERIREEMEKISDNGGKSGALDVSNALEKAKTQEKEFKKIYADQKQRLELQMQQAAQQRQRMLKKQLSK